ncbi:sigma-70 family RNA polymerase sigma factor [Thermosediminibacter oceani]|uniref:RNA polymerase sigma factor, sigma-70 family n=1 Tax=Thermosediminibacter oceani (strain ATCC BAA-1034 / DSM 16646 / JW/IW-1228P) TaxID=555079 RepID=D9RYQ7_THEOJ|nr:sigma-70 family RNA polymerase sigma factor [Thermosediminibacter oceani]ADL08481.1 RNA polymerase sigma factor, sigma-70 family [Thermosediminibacter oceani DSM 16646]
MVSIPKFYELDLDPEDARIAAWFLKGLKREARRLYLKQKKLKQHELLILNNRVDRDNDGESPELIDTLADGIDVLSRVEDRIFVREALMMLTARQQKVIMATVFEGATEKEVAERLGISQPAVNKIKNRALSKLKKYLRAI